jgi:hypothetical protein
MDQRQINRFDRDQIIFVAELILVAALDRIESCMPTAGITWEERLKGVNGYHSDAAKITAYEAGALETAGMALAVFYAQLTDDGLGIGDALGVAGNFYEACHNWVETVWENEGKTVHNKIKQLQKDNPLSGWNISEAYTNYPDCRKHAETFADFLVENYP